MVHTICSQISLRISVSLKTSVDYVICSYMLRAARVTIYWETLSLYENHNTNLLTQN